MRQRLAIAVSTTAALTAVAVLLVVFTQLDQTRRQLQSDGVLEFNFIHQVDHNLDEFAHALSDAQQQRDSGMRYGEVRWRERYDVLYSVVDRADNWAGSLLGSEQTLDMLDHLRRFVLDIEPEMTADRLPDDGRLRAITSESRDLSAELYRSGLALFKRKSNLRDDIAARMDWLTRLYRFFGALFLLAGLSLYLLMTRAIRRAARLTHEARVARKQLEIALEEVTTGDSHRKSQNRFLAAATHDLRQPLQALQYYLTALRVHVTAERGQEILAKVGRSTDAAQAMLTTLLDISRLDAGVLEPTRSPLELDALLMRLRDDYRVEASERGLTLTLDACGYWVHSDPQLLERVLRNLISNALAHTHEGGVTISCSTDGSILHLTVEDTGIGIANRELEAIFNEYYQVGPATEGTSTGPGLGLGLSIVRRLTRLMEIPIRVNSAKGCGTCFELDLPLTTPQAMEKESPVGEGYGNSGIVAGLAILIIDDESEVREGMATLLCQQGCRIIAAADADDACRLVVANGIVPDLILADLQLLGGRDGIEAIEFVREEVNEQVPAIIITGDTAPARTLDARRIGVPLLHKPVRPAELFQCIARTLDPDPLDESAALRSST